jgi:hypothetical protein
MSVALKSKIRLDTPVTVRTFALGITSLNLLDLNDVDATELEDGAMMIYDADTAKFKLTATIDHPRSKTKIIGGKY